MLPWSSAGVTEELLWDFRRRGPHEKKLFSGMKGGAWGVLESLGRSSEFSCCSFFAEGIKVTV